MSHAPGPETGPDYPPHYEIRLKGHLGHRWKDWFDHMIVTSESNGETTLTGPIVDQAAIHGVLTKVRDLGLQLLSFTRIEMVETGSSDETNDQTTDQTHTASIDSTQQ